MQTEVRKFLLSGEGNYSQTKKGAIAFAYPVEYPRRMTDRGMYTKISAYRHDLRHDAWKDTYIEATE